MNSYKEFIILLINVENTPNKLISHGYDPEGFLMMRWHAVFWLNKYDLGLGLISWLIKNNELWVQVNCLFIGRYYYHVFLSRVLACFYMLLDVSRYHPFFIAFFNITLYVSRSSTRHLWRRASA